MLAVDTTYDGQAVIVYDAIDYNLSTITVNIKFASLKPSQIRKKILVSRKKKLKIIKI